MAEAKGELKILCCQPVVIPPSLSSLAASHGYVNGVPMYQGSTKGKCQACKEEVWIGPLQKREAESVGENAAILCWKCTSVLMRGNAALEIRELGNRNKTEVGEN